MKTKYIILLAIFILVNKATYSNSLGVDSNQFERLSKTIRLMIETDPSLNDIELFYSHIQENERLQKWVGLNFDAAKRRIAELSKHFSKVTSNANLPTDLAGFIPPRWLIDSIPVPQYDPGIKKFSFDVEHAETLYQLKGLKDEVFSRLDDNGLKYQAKGNYGGEQKLVEAEKRFGYSKNNLLIVESTLASVINQATAEIIAATSTGAQDGNEEMESNSEVKKQRRAAQVTRAILLRLCNEKAFRLEVDFWMKSKLALSHVVETFYELRLAQVGESAQSKNREAEIAKLILSRSDALLYRSRWLQDRAQVIIRTFDMFIDQSRSGTE